MKLLAPIFMFTAALSIFFVMIYFNFSNPKTILDDRNCSVDGESQNAIFILDLTSELSSIQKTTILSKIRNLAFEFEENILLQIYTIGEISNEPKPIFERCTLRDGSNANYLTENRKKIEDLWKEKFYEPFSNTIDNIFTGPEQNNSQIFQTIQIANVLSSRHTTKKSIHIFSDMMQNDDSISFYSEIPSYEKFSKSLSRSYFSTNLENVKINIHLISEKNRNEKKLINFWEQYFENMSANLAINRIEGVL